MAAPGRIRTDQRAATEAAILDAAWGSYARAGPDGVSLRELGASAGCTHALIVQYFGSKEELIGAVATRLATTVDAFIEQQRPPIHELLTAARTHRSTTQLLIRTALGDLPSHGFPDCLHADELLAPSSPHARSRDRDQGANERRARLCAYATASLIAGFVTFEGFVVAGTGLGALPPARRDVAMTQAAGALIDIAATPEPGLEPRDLADHARRSRPPEEPPTTSGEALLRAAVTLFAQHGPSATSVRQIAGLAGVNPGLIHRHFGSKHALLAEAIERGLSDLFPAALGEGGFDFDAMSWLMHHGSAGPRLVARTLVDDVEITAVRQEFPVMRRLMDAYQGVPVGAGPGDVSDPRVAVAATASMALGSALWGPHLRPALGLEVDDGTESAIADLAQFLVLMPFTARSPEQGAP